MLGRDGKTGEMECFFPLGLADSKETRRAWKSSWNVREACLWSMEAGWGLG